MLQITESVLVLTGFVMERLHYLSKQINQMLTILANTKSVFTEFPRRSSDRWVTSLYRGVYHWSISPRGYSATLMISVPHRVQYK